MTDRLRVALPNKGRLEQPATELLRRAGIVFEKTGRTLSAPARNVPIELLFVRSEDIPEFVADGVARLGITGLDLVEEAGFHVEVQCELGFGRCSLTAAVPEAAPMTKLTDLDGCRIATSHPKTVERFFANKSISIVPVPLRGSVEVAPKLDVADAIVDLVSSGSTLMTNGLRPIATLLESEAVLIGSTSDSVLADSTVTMVRAVMAAQRKRYVLMNAPREAVAEIERIIPGIDAPSVVPLAHNGKVAVHSVVDRDDLWQVLPRLESVGASGILVLPVEQLIP
jgi:ATP phosphoribosyltransferase